MDHVRIGMHGLAGDLEIPDIPRGLVLFAHGSGSSRHSPRNRFVAQELNARGFVTLLMDLLTVAEDRNPERRFEIDLLAVRLEETLDWLRGHPTVGRLPVALFGASTGAAAALNAASRNPGRIFAIVSRGGRPDLATEPLGAVKAPTLLIVGGDDDVVLRLNQSALRRLPPSARLEVIPGATHLFEEPGKLEAVAALAGDWLAEHLPAKHTEFARSHVTPN